jgi:predicted ATPase/class 3 adenylate cyclase
VGQELPTGTVTFLFTDVEGSTQLLHELGAAAYADAIDAHRRVVREACARHAGTEVGTEGDAFFVVFETAPAALAAAAELTEALSSGPVRVRVGLHTGTPLLSDEGYVGVDVHRAARIAAAGHGGQVLVSQSTASLVGGDLRDLGEHRFKDLLAAERVYQLGRQDFPPLRSLARANLPVASWPLLGRERELAEIRSLVAGGVRLVTLTGPGGSGKTRLALQAAAELSEEFRDGTFFVAIAPLREAQRVHSAVAEAVGLRPDDDVVAWLAPKRVLLVLDNLEHLQGVATIVFELLVGDIVVLATSRAPLHLSPERELPVEPLPDEAAVELFVTRAAAAGGRQLDADATVGQVCRRLDNLPLALELAAARAKLLSPTALLQRLNTALPLLAGGAVDLPERQRTLRATIEWSHNLLHPDAQAAFRRLSVFRGPFTLDAAEAIADADLEEIEALLDQSLLKSLGDDRFFLLETLREYAHERLEEAGEAGDFPFRHARWYLARLEEIEPVRIGPRTPEFLAWYAAEEDNLRAMLDRLAEGTPAEAARAAALLSPYWIARGQLDEGRARLIALLASNPSTGARAVLLGRLADVEAHIGHLDAAEAAAEGAIALADTLGDRLTVTWALRARAHAAYRRGDADEAIRRARGALEEAAALDDDQARAICLADLGLFLSGAGSDGEARATLRAAVDEFRRLGDIVNEAISTLNLAELDLYAGDFEAARAGYAAAVTTVREVGYVLMQATAGFGFGRALLGLGWRHEALAALCAALDHALENGVTRDVYDTLGGIALAADENDVPAAARIRGAVEALRQREGVNRDPRDEELERRFERLLIQAVGKQAWEREQAVGALMTIEETIELARSLSRDSTCVSSGSS